jgi:hypothetical protein
LFWSPRTAPSWTRCGPPCQCLERGCSPFSTVCRESRESGASRILSQPAPGHHTLKCLEPGGSQYCITNHPVLTSQFLMVGELAVHLSRLYERSCFIIGAGRRPRVGHPRFELFQPRLQSGILGLHTHPSPQFAEEQDHAACQLKPPLLYGLH